MKQHAFPIMAGASKCLPCYITIIVNYREVFFLYHFRGILLKVIIIYEDGQRASRTGRSYKDQVITESNYGNEIAISYADND